MSSFLSDDFSAPPVEDPFFVEPEDESDEEVVIDESLFPSCLFPSSLLTFLSLSPFFRAALPVDPESIDPLKNPFRLSDVPLEWVAYPEDSLAQSTILTNIVGTAAYDDSSKEVFDNTPKRKIRLSKLKAMYDAQDPAAVNLLHNRHFIRIDDEFSVPLSTGRIIFKSEESMIDYHLTVANCVGLSTLLPNAESAHRFAFYLDLHKPFVSFKGKHAMLGFDPAGSMLNLGTCNNEDVFLAMAPNEFLRGRTRPSPPGHSSASPLMSRRHYRQIVMLFAHFLAKLPNKPYYNLRDVYRQDVDSQKPDFAKITNVMYVLSILFHLFRPSPASVPVFPRPLPVFRFLLASLAFVPPFNVHASSFRFPSPLPFFPLLSPSFSPLPIPSLSLSLRSPT
jgi:hypothetical protein